MIIFEIDGKPVEAQEGETLLEVARGNGFEIPTLCHHEALEPFGACRVCLVEVWLPSWSTAEPGKLVTSCLYPAREGLVVQTSSEMVRSTRKLVLELLLARAPRSKAIIELAARYGVRRSRFRSTDKADDCILCGLCTRICEKLGHTAISTVYRGIMKEVAPPLGKPPMACVGCGACARICPTQSIPMEETRTSRRIWDRTFELVPCEICGRGQLTREQISFFSERTGLDADCFKTCEECSRKETASRMAAHLL